MREAVSNTDDQEVGDDRRIRRSNMSDDLQSRVHKSGGVGEMTVFKQHCAC